MSVTQQTLKVISNVARDILQSAALFKTLPTVVWEYVVNSLQYVDQNITPKVVVKINPARGTATIADNASGMDEVGLQNFFTMHGQNQDRLRGRAGRGMFGTGKAAAFGIAERLSVQTVRDGLRNTVTLSRSDIVREEAKGNVTEVLPEHIERNVPTTEPNGTLITIEGITVKCDVATVIAFIEPHLGGGFKGAEVIVNGQEVEYEEPSFTQEFTFFPTSELRGILGDVKLLLRVSPAPLNQDRRGVNITSNGVLFETTLGSVEGKELAHYIFGELEVPELINQGQGPNPAFNMTRDMKLNVENLIVRAIHTFVSIHSEEVRRGLVEADRRRRETIEAQRLQRQADAIAKLLNADFTEYSDKIQRIQSTVSSVSHDRGLKGATQGGKEQKTVLFGGTDEVEVVAPEGGLGGTLPPSPPSPPNPPSPDPKTEQRNKPVVESQQDGDPLGRNATTKQSKKPSRGGFRVDFRNLGVDDNRATYDRDSRTIVINLDFPQITQASAKDGIESPLFQRLANEIAITEYAIAVSSELVNSSIYNDPSDYIFEIRKTVNRISRRVATAT
jgi:hypothetical protein